MIEEFPKWEDLIESAISRNQTNIESKHSAHSTYKEVDAFVNEIINIENLMADMGCGATQKAYVNRDIFLRERHCP